MTNEWKVLDVMVDYQTPGEFWSPLHFFEGKTGLSRAQVRRACRGLSRKGLASFNTGLMNEDGEFRGAGYGITQKGLEAWHKGPAHVARVKAGRSITRA